jgi:hypothetical protein
LTAPIDANKNFCGFDRMKGYPKMFISSWDISKGLVGIFNSGVCVKECPKDNTHKFAEGKNCKSPKNKPGICNSIKKTYKTIDALDFCLPTSTKGFKEVDKKGIAAVKQNFMSSKAGSVALDLYKSSRAIYWSMAMSIVYSIIFIYLMSKFAEVIAWCCVILI